VIVYRRPGNAIVLRAVPQLASWDRAGSPGQVRLAQFLAEVDVVAGPSVVGAAGPLALELVVGAVPGATLDRDGRDLDNYLFPIVQRLGATRFTAVFGRKAYGASTLAIAPAVPVEHVVAPQFAVTLKGSYIEQRWKQALRDRLLQAGAGTAPPGPLAVDIAIATGPGRNWANVWKPLIDSLGPLLGENPHRPFHPNDDRITALSLFHRVDATLGHDVEVALWWAADRASVQAPSQRPLSPPAPTPASAAIPAAWPSPRTATPAAATIRVVGVDVGSVNHLAGSRFAWVALDFTPPGPQCGGRVSHVGSGRDPVGAVAAVNQALQHGQLVALGLECPLVVPVPDAWQELGRARTGEGRRPWSGGAGPASMATGLVQLAWLLRRAATDGHMRVTTQPGRWTPTTPLLVWEAFVSDTAKTSTGPDAHLADADAAARAFIGGLPATIANGDEHVGNHRALNLAAVAAMHAGAHIDPDELTASPMIVKARAA
jgi:hypothetical protein